MFNQLLGYLRAWVRGENAELHIDATLHFSWAEIVIITGIIGFVVYLFCR